MATGGATGYGAAAGYPIGYWLKRLDKAIDGGLAGTLAEEGLGRRHWQAMNLLDEGPADRAALAEALRPFWGDGAITLDEVLGDLERMALVVEDGGRCTLTADGVARRAAIAERVDATRARLVDGVTREEYAATVQVLQRMTANLEG